MTGQDTARTFRPPPRTFEDREGRTVRVRAYEAPGDEEPSTPETSIDANADVDHGHDHDHDLDAGAGAPFEALVEMYVAFDPADRAQGIPPATEERIRSWLPRVLGPDCVNVVAETDDRAVGHATLVPDEEEGYELAIFVLGPYQGAGIGTELITALLGAGIERGIERVWLTVERWNTPAQHLYRKVGFEATGSEGFELEMEIGLSPDGEPFDGEE